MRAAESGSKGRAKLLHHHNNTNKVIGLLLFEEKLIVCNLWQNRKIALSAPGKSATFIRI